MQELNLNQSSTQALQGFFEAVMDAKALKQDLTGLFMNVSLMALDQETSNPDLRKQLYSLYMLIDVLNNSHND